MKFLKIQVTDIPMKIFWWASKFNWNISSCDQELLLAISRTHWSSSKAYFLILYFINKKLWTLGTWPKLAPGNCRSILQNWWHNPSTCPGAEDRDDFFGFFAMDSRGPNSIWSLDKQRAFANCCVVASEAGELFNVRAERIISKGLIVQNSDKLFAFPLFAFDHD